jgi:outer membrane protein assembly complex protein YaeT
MLYHAFLMVALLGVAGSAPLPQAQAVRRVEVTGNQRFPTLGILRLVSATPGKPYDDATGREDVRKLHATGFFQDVAVETQPSGDGRVDVRIRVKENPYISEFVVTGVAGGLEQRITEALRKEKLEFRPATPYSPAHSAKAAAFVRNLLRGQRYPMAEVTVVPEPEGNVVRAHMRIQTGPRLKVGHVEFTGNSSIPSGELLGHMKHTLPGSPWGFWSETGRYMPEELTSDLELVRQFYQSRGFATAQVGPPVVVARDAGSRIPLRARKPELCVQIPVIEGPQFTVGTVAVEGDGKMAAGQISELAAEISPPCRYDLSTLESVRARMVQALGKAGYPMADVKLEQAFDESNRDESNRKVRALFKVTAGEPAVIGRIRFEGNTRIPDKFLRRELRTREGDVFDSSRVDQSVERLNKSSLIKEMGRSDVALEMDEERQELDVVFKVKENDVRGIYGTGGLAGGGYLGLIYSVFNMCGIGERISMELDGGSSQSNMLLNLVGNHFLGSSFSIALSAFHRYTNLNMATIVPDASDVVGVFRRRSTGIGLSGSYPLTTRVQVGLAYQLSRDEISVDGAPETLTSRSEITPTLVFDSTRGTGTETRGYRVAFGRKWTGPVSMNSIESVSETFRISSFRGDPMTSGRNSFSFQLQGGIAHSGAAGLAPELRYYPGTELARGFARGGLSAWGASDTATGPHDLRVLGADAMIGLSAEYRVPLTGPLNSVAFVDLAWSRLNARNAGSITGVRPLDFTSNVIRASTGGELRLQLPVVRQPARLIFAWNPLRLDALTRGASPFRFADPRGAIRFALGDMIF